MPDLISRAYSLLEVKGYDDDEREIRGTATTPTPDRMGDVVEPLGVSFKNPTPLLWQHDATKPVGTVQFDKPTKNGITFKAKIPKITEPGILKDRTDEAWQSLKAGLLGGVSIGFRALEHSYMKEGGIHFQKTEVLELSLVTIPAQSEATISTIKSIDTRTRAALGTSGKGVTKPAGVSATPHSYRGNTMKSLNELRELRANKAARLDEIATNLKNAEYEATDEEMAEFDALEIEVKSLDRDIRIAAWDHSKAAGATRVDGGSQAAGSASRGPTVFVRNADPEDKFKGQSYTRFLVAKALAFAAMKEGNYVSPVEVAKHRWGKTNPKLIEFIKAGVAAGGTGSGDWGAELAQSDARFTGDFIEFLYSKTVFDALPLRAIPARVNVKGQDGAATGYWVGENKAIPVSKPDFSTVELTPLKVAAIAVASKELIMDSSPSAEMLIRDSIAEASAQRVDTTFLSTAAAVSGVSPAGLLNGLSALAPSGTDAAAVRADFQALIADFLTDKNAGGLVHVMTPSMAVAMSLLVNALGQTEFPAINENGGTLFGRPVYTGDNVTPGDWLVLKPSDIWKIGDTGIEVSMSDTATIEQDNAPAGAGDVPTAASATLMSLWQTEQMGFKVVRRINYAKRRTGAVKYLANGEYGGVFS
jgi:HK97 family phage prohead protease